MADKDSSVYVSESHIVSQYKSNIAGRYEVNALIIDLHQLKNMKLLVTNMQSNPIHVVNGIDSKHFRSKCC